MTVYSMPPMYPNQLDVTQLKFMAYFPLATKLLFFQLNLPFDGPAEFAAGNKRRIGGEGTLMGGI